MYRLCLICNMEKRVIKQPVLLSLISAFCIHWTLDTLVKRWEQDHFSFLFILNTSICGLYLNHYKNSDALLTK